LPDGYESEEESSAGLNTIQSSAKRQTSHDKSFTKSKKFDLAFPCVKLPEIEQDARNQRASSDPWFSRFTEPSAWKMICGYAIPSFQLVLQANVQHGNEFGWQLPLATLMAACVNILPDRVSLRREWEVDGAGYKAPIEFVFFQDELITLIVEARNTLHDVYSEAVQQVCKQLVAAWHYNFKRGGSHPVVAFLQDVDGGVAFRLEAMGDLCLEATEAFRRESFKGTIKCTSHMVAFSSSGQLPGEHFKHWIHGIFESAYMECATWDASTWKQNIAAASTRVSNAADNFLTITDALDSMKTV
jgi:hypothetical protein